MDDLKITIGTLPPEQKNEFLDFINRKSKSKVRKDAELFKLLQQKKQYTPDELQAAVYPDAENNMAYYALRKRLMQQLSDFILLKRMEEDTTAASAVMGHLSLADYLFDRGVDRLGWNLLRKAEKLAAENELFDLLNNIYNLQIAKADSENADDLTSIIARRNQNKIAADEEERANMAASLIRQQLSQARAQGRDINFGAVTQKVLHDFQLTEVMSQRPSLFYKLMVINRSAVLARKDFHAFEPFIIAQYQQLEQHTGFAKRHLFYKLSLLIMIAHVLYRTRKFGKSVAYLELLFESLQTDNKSLFGQFFSRYIFLKSANYAFMQRLEESAELLEDLLKQTTVPLSVKEQLTAHIGLSFVNFAMGNFKKASLYLIRLPHSDTFCAKKMGREWVLKKSIGELIIQIELQNPELALNKIRIVERTFRDLLAQPAYQNVKGFLELLKMYLADPDTLARLGFMDMVEQELSFAPHDQDDLQEISFYAWLKAKMQNRPYYEVLLELTAAATPAEAV